MNATIADRAFWDSYWEGYAGVLSDNPTRAYRHGLILRLLDRGTGQDMRFVDIGCGQGELITRVANRFPHSAVLGVDISEKAIRLARDMNHRAEFMASDIRDPEGLHKTHPGWATHAACSEVLEHVDDEKAFLRDSARIMTDGGTLIVTVPGGPMSAWDRHIGHRRHYTRALLRNTLEQAGYSVSRVFLAGFPFLNLYRVGLIMRGASLIEDMKLGNRGPHRFAIAVLDSTARLVFRFNLTDSPLGWQIVALARKDPDPARKTIFSSEG
jgi:SAM-dependent methyltransferase